MDTSKIGKTKPTEKPEEKPEEDLEEYDPKDDQIAELSFSNEELRFENEVFKSKEVILSGDQAKIDEEITRLRNQVKALEAELRAVKNSRDQFQAKNAELINQVNYYKKQLDKKK
jgi:non-homologous end joining protein Ku